MNALFKPNRRGGVAPRLRLRLEPLESRTMLDAAWPGAVIHDAAGNIFTLDMDNEMALEWAGNTLTDAGVVLYDMAFSPAPESKLYGVTLPDGLPTEVGFSGGFSELVSFDIDLSGEIPVITLEWVHAITMGIDNGIYVNSLQFNTAGELFAAGQDVDGDNWLFKIDPDTRGANRVLELDSHTSAGDLGVDSFNNLHLTTLEGDLIQIPPDQDSYNLIGQTVGPLGLIDDFYGLMTGPEPLLYGFRSGGEVYLLDALDADATFVGQLDPYGLAGLYDVYGAATVFPPPTDLGEVDFRDLPGEEPVLGKLWYRLVAANDAILTVDLPDVAPGSEVTLSLYEFNSQGELEQLPTQDLGELRLDYEEAVQGAEYFVEIEGVESPVDVRVTNLVSLVGNGAHVRGTDQDDTFEFAPGPPYTVMINGVNYPYNFGSTLVTVTFDGGIGRDEAWLTGSFRDDVGELNIGLAHGQVEQLALAPYYRVIVNSTPRMTFDGAGGHDEATLTASAAADTIVLTPTTATITDGISSLSVMGVEAIDVQGGTGYDTATFTGTAGNETANLSYLDAEFVPTSGAGFRTTLADVEKIVASGGGGDDTAHLTGRDVSGSSGQDRFTGNPSMSWLIGHDKSFFFNVAGFNSVVAHGNRGSDVAVMTGGAGLLDTFEAMPEVAEMSATGAGAYSLRAENFRYLHGSGNESDQDVARVYGLPGAQDTLDASPDETRLFNPGNVHFVRARTFRYLSAFGNPGDGDVAMLKDVPGQPDTFDYEPQNHTAVLWGFGFSTQVNDFQYVHATGTPGDGDMAYLDDDPAGADTFEACPEYARIFNDDHHGRANHFSRVEATVTPGHDNLAKLYDNPTSADTFEGSPDSARQYGIREDGNTYVNTAIAFRWAHSWATPGFGDEAYFFDDPYGNDTFKGYPHKARLYRDDAYFVQAKWYRYVYADATQSAFSYDRAVLNDSALTDYLTASGNTARMSDDPTHTDPGYFYRVRRFSRVIAKSTTPSGDYKDVAAIDYLLLLRGFWEDLP